MVRAARLRGLLAAAPAREVRALLRSGGGGLHLGDPHAALRRALGRGVEREARLRARRLPQHPRALREQAVVAGGAWCTRARRSRSHPTWLGGAGARSTTGAKRAPDRAAFDQVFFTGPTRLARAVVDPSLLPIVEQAEIEHPAAGAYLGVACLVLAMKRRLTPFYVLNVGDESIELTGVIEMTNLVDRDAETAGLSLVYVPHYMDSADPRLLADDDAIEKGLVERGLLRMFPDVSRRRIHLPPRAPNEVRPATSPGSRRAPQAASVSRTVPAPDPQYLDAEVRHPEQRRGGRVRRSVRRLHGHLNASGAEGRPSMARPSDIFPSATTRAIVTLEPGAENAYLRSSDGGIVPRW